MDNWAELWKEIEVYIKKNWRFISIQYFRELEEHQHMRIMELEERHEQEKIFMQKEITKVINST